LYAEISLLRIHIEQTPRSFVLRNVGAIEPRLKRAQIAEKNLQAQIAMGKNTVLERANINTSAEKTRQHGKTEGLLSESVQDAPRNLLNGARLFICATGINAQYAEVLDIFTLTT